MHETKCWDCARACGLCPWSEYKRQRPVPGWTAKRRDVKMQGTWCGRLVTRRVESYLVLDCPLFVESVREGETEKQTHRRWTEDETKRLDKLRRRGLTQKEIAAQLGRSPASVKKKLKQMRGARHG